MESKDIIIITVGIIGSIITAIVVERIPNFNTTNFLFLLIITLTFLILIIAYYLSRRLREIDDKLNNHEVNIKKLNEKLKIHEQLIDIKSDIKTLQEKVFKR